LCPDNIAKGTRITIANRDFFGKGFSDAVVLVLGPAESVSIINVVEGLAAEKQV